MSRRLLLQSILKFREGIKSGTAKVQDIVEDYFKSSGKSVTEEDRAIILNEFAESAPEISLLLYVQKNRFQSI